MGKIQINKVTKEVENTLFKCGNLSIESYIRESYFPMICQHAYAYSVMSGNILLGYYQILLRDIELADFPDEISEYSSGWHDYKIASVHIRYIAIDEKYQKKGIGTSVLRTIIKSIELLAEDWPIRVITVDARIELISWYKREGFLEMVRNTPGQDGTSVTMYFDCMRHNEELEKYIDEIYEEVTS